MFVKDVDHSTVHLIPTYNAFLKRHKPEIKMFESLKGCFICTDWEVFHSNNIDEANVVMMDNIICCTENVESLKEVIINPNNKPYYNK